MQMQPSAALRSACNHASGLASRDVKEVLQGQQRVEEGRAVVCTTELLQSA